MAAGLGFKTFVTGEVLTAGDTNGYLMQGINVFATTAARDAAITAPQEGQFAFTKDTNGLWYYDGAAWVASGATGDIEGVTAGIGISGGGTSGTVTVTNSMATAIDAKGDLVAGTGADAFSRIAVGANNTVLTADSAEATGLKWATPAATGKSFSLLNSGGTALSGSTTTISGISGMDMVFCLITLASGTSSGATFRWVINGNTGSVYSQFGLSAFSNASYSRDIFYAKIKNAAASLDFAGMGGVAGYAAGGMQIIGANTSGIKMLSGVSGIVSDGVDTANTIFQGIYSDTNTISSIGLTTTAGTFDTGTIYVYGAA